jgi:putative ABC transport system ATP-binding protein
MPVIMAVPPRSASATDVSKANDDASPLLACENLEKAYTRGHGSSGWFGSSGSEATTVAAVDAVSLAVSPGEIVGIAGPSGSGKSTLLHLLAGLEQPTNGRVTFEGKDIDDLSDRERTRHRLNNVGIVFQRFHLLPSLSARANVALPLVELGVSRGERRRRATQLLEQIGLGDRVKHRPGELSGGEQQRVAIARALVTDPELVVADEPTGELDTETGQRVLDAFEQVAEERAVVVASHDQETLDIADRVIQLRDGKIVDDGASER